MEGRARSLTPFAPAFWVSNLAPLPVSAWPPSCLERWPRYLRRACLCSKRPATRGDRGDRAGQRDAQRRHRGGGAKPSKPCTPDGRTTQKQKSDGGFRRLATSPSRGARQALVYASRGIGARSREGWAAMVTAGGVLEIRAGRCSALWELLVFLKMDGSRACRTNIKYLLQAWCCGI